MSTFAEPSEIEYAHDLLLNNLPQFEKDKIDIILCNESKDIKACPGSGKTTTLLAKLAILANRMPLPNGQGICVLTHTNVAINEIKAKLGNKADLLFVYPNFFGTIQVFIDKFFAIPYFNYISDVELRFIDDDIAKRYISNAFHHKGFEDKKCIWGQIKDRIPNKIPVGKTKTNIINEIQFDLLYNSWYNVKNKKFYRKYGIEKAIASNSNTDIYNLFSDVRLNALKHGVLKYDDAFSYAMANIESTSILEEAIANRFKYLFIDEMQDTNQKQIDVIEKIFNPKKVIIQRFGDNCQAIYNTSLEEGVWEPKEYLPINISKRFGENIARVLRTICIENNVSLQANKSIESCMPIILVYDDPGKVLPIFAKLVKTKKIHNKTLWDIARTKKEKDPRHRNFIKAIGWVGKDKSDNKITIKSYFPEFERGDGIKIKSEELYLSSYITKSTSLKVIDYVNNIINSILMLLQLAECKNNANNKERYFTKTTLFDKIKKNNEEFYLSFREKLAVWAKLITNSPNIFNQDVYISLKDFIEKDLPSVIKYDNNSQKVIRFLNYRDETLLLKEENMQDVQNRNLFIHEQVEIEVGTIHSAKGETHLATLYMETSYQKKCEGNRILDQLKGIPFSGNDRFTFDTLKVAYVGMSRPQYLLCMAMHKSNFIDSPELRSIWEILEI